MEGESDSGVGGMMMVVVVLMVKVVDDSNGVAFGCLGKGDGAGSGHDVKIGVMV